MRSNSFSLGNDVTAASYRGLIRERDTNVERGVVLITTFDHYSRLKDWLIGEDMILHNVMYFWNFVRWLVR